MDVFDFMLATWYDEYLCQPDVDGIKSLVNILNDEDVAEYSPARKMSPIVISSDILIIDEDPIHKTRVTHVSNSMSGNSDEDKEEMFYIPGYVR